MNPQEKANQLFNKMYKYQLDKRSPVSWKTAIKLATISVDEMIAELQTYSDLESTIIQHGCLVSVIDRLQYWQSVRSELNNL